MKNHIIKSLSNFSNKWLLFSIFSLLAAGILTFVIVFSRTPIIKDFFIFKDFFRKALIVHVNLSQLYWFLSIGVLLNFYYLCSHKLLNKFCFYAAILSLIGIITSVFIPGESILNNYVPVLDNLLFKISIFIFFVIILAVSFINLFNDSDFLNNKESFTISLLKIYNILILIAFTHFLISYKFIENNNITLEFYEIFFWGFGHILQFSYVILMVLAWYLIIKRTESVILFSDNLLKIFAALYLFVSLYSYASLSLTNDTVTYFKNFYTNHMIWGSSLLALIFIIAILPNFFSFKFYKKDAEYKPLINCLILSIILFIYGGLLGSRISESNTLIPAHYHGSIVAVTIALIGLTYIFLPQFGGAKISSKLAIMQPIIYGVGQIIHITGLAISGGYGVLRKSPDSILGFNAKFWMGIMGFGGLITMIAGLMFLIICYKSIINSSKKNVRYKNL
jgi:cytochrome c oxidase subunit 1